MEGTQVKSRTGGGQAVQSVEIPPDLEALFDALPEGGKSNPGKTWTPAEDAILLKYWPVKKHAAVAKQLGVSANTALKRYRELTSG